MVLRRMCILWIWGGEFCKCLSGLLAPNLILVLDILVNFLLIDLSNIDSGVLKSLTVIVWDSKSLCRLLRTCFMYLGAPVLGVYIFRIVSSS